MRACLRLPLAAVTLAVLVALSSSPVPPFQAEAADSSTAWQLLEPGLELGELAMPTPSTIGDSRLTALRIDPRHFDLKLMNASAPGQGRALSARAWCERSGLVAAINASMYQTDLKTSVSLMRNADHVNNARLTRDRAVLVFDPVAADIPVVDLIDLTCQDFAALRPQYRSFVQSIRMVSCEGNNTWQQQPRRFSTAAIAVDQAGRVLFMHCRSPYSTHDFIDGLLALPLDIAKAMYAEGGPQAQLYARAGGREIERVGVFENVILDADDEQSGWPIPNVVGIVRRPQPR